MSNLGSLLAWGIENTNPELNPEGPRTQLNPQLLAELFGANQKSDADRMRESMEAIEDPEMPLADKLIAFDNFELLIEQLDNANNIENLKLWPRILAQLSNPEPEIRKLAAWCIGTAVQNNVNSQNAFHGHDGVPKLVEVALKDEEEQVRRKAVYALSSMVRNHQPGWERMRTCLPVELKEVVGEATAEDMEKVDELMRVFRERVSKVISQ